MCSSDLLLAILLDFVRGAAMTGAGAWIAMSVVPRLGERWPLGTDDTRGLLLVGAAVSVGILLRSFGGLARRRALFLTGLSLGIAGGLLL